MKIDQQTVEELLVREQVQFNVPFDNKDRKGKLSTEARILLYKNTYYALRIYGIMSANDVHTLLRKVEHVRRYATYFRIVAILREMYQLKYILTKNVKNKNLYYIEEDKK